MNATEERYLYLISLFEPLQRYTMKRLITLLIFICCFTGIIIAQDSPHVMVPSFNDKYSKSVKQLEAGNTDIDYTAFRDSFIESEQFKVANKQRNSFDSLRKQMYVFMNNKDSKSIAKVTKAMLSIDYTSMIAHKILSQTYKAMGDTANWKKYHDIEFGLLKSIVTKGDGRSCATAWPVIQVDEEYFILDMLGDSLLKQTLDNSGGICDKMMVKGEDGKKTYYFEVSKVFEGYKKLGLR